MAAGTTLIAGALMAGGTAMNAISSIKKGREGRRMREEGQAGIDNFEWQDIESAIPIRTEGINMLREENARISAAAMEAIERGGTRGLAAIGDVIGRGNELNQRIRASLEDQYTRRDYTRLGMIEKRQADELAGYGQLMNVGTQMELQSRADLANSIAAMGSTMLAYGSMETDSDIEERQARKAERRLARQQNRLNRANSRQYRDSGGDLDASIYGQGINPWDIYTGGYSLLS